MGKYVLRCAKDNTILDIHEKFKFSCDKHYSLIRSSYYLRYLNFRILPGIWEFYDWLPVEKIDSYEGRPIVYKSEHLADYLGLKNLYIAFNGYWPEIGALIKTCTFKELEAVVTFQYAQGSPFKKLIIASAGNTANAFAYIASRKKFPVVILVPEKCLCDCWAPSIDREYVKLVTVGDGDYSDAIALAKKLSSKEVAYEGGGNSIARRDALGTVLLSAVRKTGKLPNHYFQAAGSGTGGIAVWEASLRLLEDGRFGKKLPKLHLSQNYPFIPMVKAWSEKRREIIPGEDYPLREDILDVIFARVLSTKYPLYSIRGGVYDALKNTNGEMYAVTNSEGIKASKIFKSLEGIDIHPAAGIAVASLMQAVEKGKVGDRELILLNITGGGKKKLEEEIGIKSFAPDVIVSKDATAEELREAVF
jgi:cysteate synthase